MCRVKFNLNNCIQLININNLFSIIIDVIFGLSQWYNVRPYKKNFLLITLFFVFWCVRIIDPLRPIRFSYALSCLDKSKSHENGLQKLENVLKTFFISHWLLQRTAHCLKLCLVFYTKKILWRLKVI